MKKLLLLLALSINAAHAQDEYYALSSAMTTVSGDTAANGGVVGPLTVTGWIETDGFGVTGFQPGCNRATEQGTACYVDRIVGYDVNITYNGVTETMSGSGTGLLEAGNQLPLGIVATPKGLFCNLCSGSNQGFPFFEMWAGRIGSAPAAGGAFYQYEAPSGTLAFETPTLKNNFRIGNAPTTVMPGTAMVPAGHAAAPELSTSGAGAALTLLIGTALVLRGRRRG